jgi:hypothetical protein
MTDFLTKLFAAIEVEAQENPAFCVRLRRIIDSIPEPGCAARESKITTRNGRASPAVRRHRRPAGVIDPMRLMSSEGEPALRQRLAGLDVEELKDIVAEHGMDTTKLAMKWRKPERLVALIVTTVRDRLSKGSAFRSPRDTSSTIHPEIVEEPGLGPGHGRREIGPRN